MKKPATDWWRAGEKERRLFASPGELVRPVGRAVVGEVLVATSRLAVVTRREARRVLRAGCGATGLVTLMYMLTVPATTAGVGHHGAN